EDDVMARRKRTVRDPNQILLGAARSDDPETLTWALDNGADINVQGLFKSGTALHKAGYKTAQILIDRGADIHATDVDGNTPLHTAASRTEPEVVSMLIEAGADPNARNKRGQTPLHLAL